MLEKKFSVRDWTPLKLNIAECFFSKVTAICIESLIAGSFE